MTIPHTTIPCFTGDHDRCSEVDPDTCQCVCHELACLAVETTLAQRRDAQLCACRMRHPSGYQPGGTIDPDFVDFEPSANAKRLMYGDAS